MKYLSVVSMLFFIAFSGCQNQIENEQKGDSSEGDKSGAVTVGGTQLEYSIKGKGTPFLVVGSSADYFSEDLQNHFRFYFIDTRATAKNYTPIDTSKYTVETLLNDIDTLRKVLGLEKFVIAGHSIMGGISLQYARKHPKLISHVVMIGTPRFYGTEEFKQAINDYWETAPEERKELLEKKQRQLAEVQDTTQSSQANAFVKSLVADSPRRWHDANFDATKYLEKVHFNMDFAAHLLGKLFPKFDLCALDKEFDLPVFVATGISDYVSPPTLWQGECISLPNLTVSLFDESGHTPHFEQSEVFNKRIIDWINKN